MSVPQKMKAIVVQENKTVKVEEVPVPTLKENEILLKVLAIGQNPTDWKHVEFQIAEPGALSGCDFVGKVVQLGSAVPTDKVKKDEVRWGFMRGGVSTGRGAFAEYVPVEWDISSVVPNNITPAQAASIPIPLVTAVQAYYLRLKLPEPPQPSSDKWLLVWSGASAVGQYAIQLAKLSGFKVATTASQRRWELLKSYGADFMVDYKDPDVVDKLKKGTNDGIVFGIDCVSDTSIQLAQQAFGPAGGTLVAILFNNNKNPIRKDVKVFETLAYTALGHSQSFGKYSDVFESTPEDRALFAKWCLKSTELFGSGQLKPLPIEDIGGLEKVQEGFQRMKEGRYDTKLVHTVATE